jgi:hypothetical protein
MLAEKFFLVLETLKSHASDGSAKVVSTAPHIPLSCQPSQEAASVGGLSRPSRRTLITHHPIATPPPRE